MDTIELARRLKLHPRAVVLSGRISERQKNAGALSGWVPHYATSGCPIVQYQGANALEEPATAEIEFVLVESSHPWPSILPPKTNNLVQLLFGRAGQGPTQGAYRVLREAGSMLKAIADAKRDVYLVAVPVLKSGQYGVASGNLYPAAVFGTDGSPLWVHPEAQERVLVCDYPAQQKERSLLPEPTPETRSDVEAVQDWYRPLARGLETVLKGPKLHEAILRARAQQLVDRKVAPSMDAALVLVKQEVDKAVDQAAPKGRRSAGKALIALAAQSPVREKGARARER